MTAANMMLWSGVPGTWLFGVLMDGTVFQFLAEAGWRTVVGPQPEEEALSLVLQMTAMAESSGVRLTEGPKEFSVEESVLNAIRENRNWEHTGPVLFEALWT